jgi:hypothetical protein
MSQDRAPLPKYLMTQPDPAATSRDRMIAAAAAMITEARALVRELANSRPLPPKPV